MGRVGHSGFDNQSLHQIKDLTKNIWYFLNFFGTVTGTFFRKGHFNNTHFFAFYTYPINVNCLKVHIKVSKGHDA